MGVIPGIGGSVNAAVGGVVVGTPDISGLGASYSDVSDSPASVTVSLLSNGNITVTTASSGTVYSGVWLAPQSGMTSFDARWTNNTGSINSGNSAAVWHALGTSTISFGRTQSGVGGSSVNGTLEIRPTGGGSTITSKTMDFSVTRTP